MKAWLAGLVGAAALAAGLGLAAFAPPAALPVALRVALPVAQAPAPAVRLQPPSEVPRAVVALPPAPLASTTKLDRLVAAARQGDRRAGYGAYQALSACSAVGACRGLPASLVQERLRFLADAAAAGIADAQIDFYMEGPDAQQALDGDALQAWRQQALGGLTAAAAQCEPFAMGLLATLYDAGELMPRDATQALAYAVAEGQLRHRPPGDDALRDRLAEPATDAALAAARQQGQRLAAGCS
jgi:hypothetical protein